MVEAEVDFDETKFKDEKFDSDRCISLLKKFNSEPEIDCKCLTALLLEFVKIINEMSSALSVAFKDVTDKVATLRGNYKLHPDWDVLLFPFIKKEVAAGIAVLNGENNKKNTKDPKYAKYESSARTLLRMTWFMEFLKVFFGDLGKDQNRSASDAAKLGYEKALGPHHSFMLRQVAKVAMVAAPGRKSFNSKLFPTHTPEKICEILLAMEAELVTATKTLWDFYNDNKLTELP